jgi:hypothetical protein
VRAFAESRRRESLVARASVADWERARYLERVEQMLEDAPNRGPYAGGDIGGCRGSPARLVMLPCRASAEAISSGFSDRERSEWRVDVHRHRRSSHDV